jgi:hypothetical protein
VSVCGLLFVSVLCVLYCRARKEAGCKACVLIKLQLTKIEHFVLFEVSMPVAVPNCTVERHRHVCVCVLDTCVYVCVRARLRLSCSELT